MSTENVDVVRGVFEAHARADWDGVYALYAPHIEWEDVDSIWLDWGTARGPEGIREAWRRWLGALDRVEFLPEGFIEAGNDVVVPLRMRGVGHESGLDTEQRITLVWTIDQSKVVRVRAYLNHADALEAAGLPAG